MPFKRSYSSDDIGYSARGGRLNFDVYGRVAVIHEGVYAVLNDTVWLNIAGSGKDRTPMLNVIQGPDGRMYYGGRASWGVAEIKADGLLHASPLCPPDSPEWVRSTMFHDLISTKDGVYFSGPNGCVFWSHRTQQTLFFEHSRISRAFAVGATVYLSAWEQPLHSIDIVAGRLRSAAGTELDGVAVKFATTLDETQTLVSLFDGRFFVYDGKRLRPWEGLERNGLPGAVSALHRLIDGCIAIGITGRGMFLFSEDGEIQLSLNTPEYHLSTAVANREPGVLWVATEEGVEKVFYRSALTTFGQPLDLTVSWPIVVRWQESLFVASGGKLYRAVDGAPGEPTRFGVYPDQPATGAWALAAAGARMLVGSTEAVYSMEKDGRLKSIARIKDVAHLIMADEEHGYAIGRSEIALLEWRDGGWVETVARTRGVTYPSIAHLAGRSAWIEMAGSVARLALRDRQLELQVIPNASWTKSHWVNVGVIDDTVVLSGEPGERRLFDEKTGTWIKSPEIDQLLDRSPFWISRVTKDAGGTLWATHGDGVITFTPRGTDYDIDSSTFDLINERYPFLYTLPGNDVWISASRSLYHVEPRWRTEAPRTLKPSLVSVIDAEGQERITSGTEPAAAPLLPFAKNSLTFRFYSGTDAVRRSPTYEYRIEEQEPWTAMAGSQLTLRGLREGEYALQVRVSERTGKCGAIATFPFEILAPWYRTWPAYAALAAVFSTLGLGLVRWSGHLQRRRNQQLEKLVEDRTHQLKAAMSKLGEETRHAATLAERNRLANEIHDSVQQGLTGAMLQLDTTLKSSDFSDELLSRLKVMRNMISYARQEVQHAVWDMETPLLDGCDLGDALRNLTSFLNAEGVQLEITLSGQPVPLGRMANHNLLRIAQEATTNAFRHSKAQRITVHLSYGDNTVSLTISDDGIGFAPNDVLQNRTGHLGLRGIRTRAKKLKGQLVIDSAPQRGTRLRIEVPLPSLPDEASPGTPLLL